MQNDPLIIFTDLDGTLLDLHSYSYEGTESALSKIQKRNIPLIFCSSKTRTEQEFYQRELGIDHPFIVENGGAIFIRKGGEWTTLQVQHIDKKLSVYSH